MADRDRARAVASAVRALSRGDARARVLDVLARDGDLSGPMAAWALDATAARYTERAAEVCAERADLEGRDVGVILSASVATAPLRAVALPCLRGARRVVVRPSRRRGAFARLVAFGFASAGLPVAIAEEDDPAAFVDAARRRGVDRIVAYGDDETVARLAASLPEGVELEGYGHGFGVAIVTREAASSEEAIAGVARDVAHYDQLGCLSPQLVFVEGPAAPVAAALHRELDTLDATLPRGPLDVGLASRIQQWRGACAAIAEDFHRGKTHAVACLATPQFRGSPGGRNVCVVPVASLDDVVELLRPHARHLTNVGVAGARERVAELFAVALPFGPRRVVDAGAMQDPPLDGPEDKRPPTRR